MMGNPLMNGGGMPSMQQIMTQFQSFQRNPMQFLIQRKFNIPQELAGDPRGMVQHLLNSGQMSQQQLQQLQQIVPGFQQGVQNFKGGNK